MPDPILGEQQFIPNALVNNQRTRFYRDPNSGSMSIQYSIDGGENWSEFISQPSSIATEGWVPTVDVTGKNVVWRPINSLISSSKTSSSTGKESNKSGFVDFYFPGTLFAGKTFGFFDIPRDTSITFYAMQVSFFMTPSGGPTILQLIENSKSSVINETVIEQGKIFHYEFFFEEKTFITGDEIRMKILSVAPESPGEFMTCRLLFK
jgi:hypothetical protein